MNEEIKNEPTQNEISEAVEEIAPAPKPRKPRAKKATSEQPLAETAEAASEEKPAPKPRKPRAKKTEPAEPVAEATEAVEAEGEKNPLPDTEENQATKEIKADEPSFPVEEENTAPDESESAAEQKEDMEEPAPEELPAEEPIEEDARFINVEHFSDYRSAASIAAEESEKAAAEATDEAEVFPVKEVVYENLTIFDDCLVPEEPNVQKEAPAEEPEVAEADEDGKKYDPEKPRKIDGRFELIELFVFTLVAVMLLTTFIFRHTVVDGPSMENTLIEGEHLIISDVFYTPKAGDIIVFEDYSTGLHKAVVKRVIATEGQVVQITPDAVIVDGVEINEPYVNHAPGYNYYAASEHLLTKYKNGYEIPEGKIFVMGDHRDYSTDSREFDAISEETVLGKVILRIYPFEKDKFGKVE